MGSRSVLADGNLTFHPFPGPLDDKSLAEEQRHVRHFKINPSDFSGTVLVTGAGGCIGSWALALLVRAGVPAAAFDLTEDKRRLDC
jgi:NADPH:quinone reductase-like Zn-dependent oxidoreductase